MPYMQTALSSMNSAFSAEEIEALEASSKERWSPADNATLTDALRSMPGLRDLPDAVVAFIDTWPSAIQAAVKAVIYENFNRDATVPITFAWKPGYDFSVEIYDVTDTASSRGGITMLLTSRYPDDTHPLKVTGN